MERVEKDDSQKTKLIFIGLAAVVAALLIWSVAAASKAKSGLNAAKQELEIVKTDNAKLELIVKDLSQENDSLKLKIRQLEATAKAKPKPAAKKKTPSKISSKKTTKKSR
jgi:type II secretory pathway pseudopilin PulG